MLAQQILVTRSSKRDFLDRQIPEAIVDEIIETALSAPSASNTQPYKFAIATGSVRDEIATDLTAIFDAANDIKRSRSSMKFLRAWIKGVLPSYDINPVVNYSEELMNRKLSCGSQLYQNLGIERGDTKSRDQQLRKNFEFFGAPVVVFVFINRQSAVHSAFDAGMFMHSIMLSAMDYGLGTCAQGALAIWADPVKKHFEIDSDYKLICGLSMGYPSEDLVNQFSPKKLDRCKLEFN